MCEVNRLQRSFRAEREEQVQGILKHRNVNRRFVCTVLSSPDPIKR